MNIDERIKANRAAGVNHYQMLHHYFGHKVGDDPALPAKTLLYSLQVLAWEIDAELGKYKLDVLFTMQDHKASCTLAMSVEALCALSSGIRTATKHAQFLQCVEMHIGFAGHNGIPQAELCVDGTEIKNHGIEVLRIVNYPAKATDINNKVAYLQLSCRGVGSYSFEARWDDDTIKDFMRAVHKAEQWAECME